MPFPWQAGTAGKTQLARQTRLRQDSRTGQPRKGDFESSGASVASVDRSNKETLRWVRSTVKAICGRAFQIVKT